MPRLYVAPPPLPLAPPRRPILPILAALQTSLSVFSEQLDNGFTADTVNSWSSTQATNNGAVSPAAYAGANDYSITYTAQYGAAIIHRSTAFSSDGFTSFDFAVYSAIDTYIGITALNSAEVGLYSYKQIIHIPAGVWTTVSISTGLLVNNIVTSLKGIIISDQSVTFSASNPIYFDSMIFVGIPPGNPPPPPAIGRQSYAIAWPDLWAIAAPTNNPIGSTIPAELTPSVISAYAVPSKGVRLFRLSFRWTYMQPTLYGALDASYLARVLYGCRSAAANNAKVIVDCHQVGAQYNGMYIGSVGLPYTALTDFWTKLTTALKADTQAWAGIYGLEIMNEPGQTDGSWLGDQATAGGSGYRAGIAGIRAVDSDVLILVSGEGYTNCSSWGSSAPNNNNMVLPDGKCIITGHQYFDVSYSGVYGGQSFWAANGRATLPGEEGGITPAQAVARFDPWISFLATKGYKGFVSEFGVPASGGTNTTWMPILSAVCAMLDANQNVVGWSAWTGGGAGIGDSDSWQYNGSQGIPPWDPNGVTQIGPLNAHWTVLSLYPTGNLDVSLTPSFPPFPARRYIPVMN